MKPAQFRTVRGKFAAADNANADRHKCALLTPV